MEVFDRWCLQKWFLERPFYDTNEFFDADMDFLLHQVAFNTKTSTWLKCFGLEVLFLCLAVLIYPFWFGILEQCCTFSTCHSCRTSRLENDANLLRTACWWIGWVVASHEFRVMCTEWFCTSPVCRRLLDPPPGSLLYLSISQGYF